MAASFFWKSLAERILDKPSYRLPALVQSQITQRLQKRIKEDYGVRIAIAPHEITSARLPNGQTQAHLNLDINVDKATLTRLVENIIYDKTGIRVTVSPNNLTVRDRSAAVTGAHLNADITFDPADLLSKL